MEGLKKQRTVLHSDNRRERCGQLMKRRYKEVFTGVLCADKELIRNKP